MKLQFFPHNQMYMYTGSFPMVWTHQNNRETDRLVIKHSVEKWIAAPSTGSVVKKFFLCIPRRRN